jgi:hypothetical protein
MKMNDARKLEDFVRRAVDGIPDRRAPHTLEARILAEIDRRAALPWWRQSYSHWPIAARWAFLAVSAAAAAILIAAVMTFLQNPGTVQATGEVAQRFAWLGVAKDTLETLLYDARGVFESIPTLWVYGGLAVIASCYATLIGVGAAAYRTFFARR